jgi:hypothetical protein
MENKILKVKELVFNDPTPSIAQIKYAMDENNIEYNKIDCINWPEYNGDYNAEVKFRIAYSASEIYIQFLVKEDDVKAVYGEDEGSLPYTDSCVEFFLIPGEGGEYYNLELNCIGKGTFAGGLQRDSRTHFGSDVMSKIRREASLGTVAFGTKTKEQNNGDSYLWCVTAALPIELFTLSKVDPLKGREIKANFYKCGDDMPKCHFISWNPINFEQPNFHKPEFFGTLIFE